MECDSDSGIDITELQRRRNDNNEGENNANNDGRNQVDRLCRQVLKTDIAKGDNN